MMRTKKGRGAKTPTGPQDESQKDPAFDSLESHNLSSIERASFLEAAQQNYGNPLHSTAVEEDLNLPEEGAVERRLGGRRGGVRKGGLQTGRAAAMKQHGAASQRKGKEEEKEEKSRRNIDGKVKARPGKGEKKRKTDAIEEERGESDMQGEGSDPGPAPRKTNQPILSSDGATANDIRRLVGKRPAKMTVGQTSAARPVKNGGMKREKKRKRDAGSKKSNGLQSQEESDSDPTQQSRQPIPSTDEVTDEDTSWTPSQKRARVYSLGRKFSSDRSKTRKSSSGSESAKVEETSRDQQKERRRGRRGGTELDLVLDAFLNFCDQYRESVESPAVRQAIDSLSTSVKEQLTEKITTSKELRVLRRDNIKVDSLIRKKRQRLLDAKYELIRAERQLRSLQKEEAVLVLRLADLRRGDAFLRDIKELNRQYLDHRRKHPKEKEEYGASSLPALLLETKNVLGTEHQLKRINNRLADRLQETGK